MKGLLVIAASVLLVAAQNAAQPPHGANAHRMAGVYNKFYLQTTPTPTQTIPTIPSQPTTFDPSICSAYPEICSNAGIPFPSTTS